MKILAWPAPSRSQANPYLSLVYSEFENEEVEIEPYSTWNARASRADVFHVHWPEAIFWGRIAQYLPVTTKFAAFHALHTMDVVRGRGGILVWTVHNIAPHDLTLRDHERAWDWFFPKFRTRVDALIGLSSRSLDLVCESYPELRSCSRSIVPHPHYRTVYPVPPSVVEARAALSLPQEGFVAAIIGAARRSKGIPSAIQVFRVARRQDERLLIAGHCPDASLAAEIENAIGNDASVIFENRYLADPDLVSCFAAADVVLINQSSTLNSGTLMLALSMDRPAIAPAKGSVVELAETFGPSWISTFSGELDAQSLRNCLDAVRSNKRCCYQRAPLGDRSAAVSRATITALRTVLAAGRRTGG